MNRMEKHLTVVAALQVGLGLFGLIIGIFVFLLLTSIGVASQEEEAMFVLSTVGTSVGGLLFIISAPAVIGGLGLFGRRRWARVLILIVSAIDLINIPIGTLLGIYSIWVLVQEDTVLLFRDAPSLPPQAPPAAYPEA